MKTIKGRSIMKIRFIRVLIFAFLAASLLGARESPAKPQELPVIEAQLGTAPSVPPPIARDYEARVIVRLEAKEYRAELSKGVEYDYWGYNGQVPGPFVRVREGDTIEFHFKNSEGSKNTHTIDFHSMTGPCGAACILSTEPGKESIIQAKALNPGLFVYHCGAAPIPVHISNGLYGLILVEPKRGLSKVDREYYVMQSEFYTEQPIGTKGLATFSSQKGTDERPTYVVFDSVYREGSLSEPNHNIQTTLIPSGSAGAVEFKTQVPGDYTMVDHSIFRINKGAMGQIHVEGKERPDILSKIKGGE